MQSSKNNTFLKIPLFVDIPNTTVNSPKDGINSGD